MKTKLLFHIYNIYIFLKFFIIIIIYLFLIKKNNFINGQSFINNYYDNDYFKNLYDLYKKKINILMKLKKEKIEKIFLLIGIMPYLTKNSQKLKKNYIKGNKIFTNIFTDKQIKDNNFCLNKNNFENFSLKFNELLYYKWELIPEKKLIINLRYIINKYYNDDCLEIFDKSLNLNYEYYIKDNRYKLTLGKINELMSKFKFKFCLYRKFGYL